MQLFTLRDNQEHLEKFKDKITSELYEKILKIIEDKEEISELLEYLGNISLYIDTFSIINNFIEVFYNKYPIKSFT